MAGRTEEAGEDADTEPDKESACEEQCMLSAPPQVCGGDRAATARLVLTSAAGLFADGWDLQVINLVLAVMGPLYPGSINESGKAKAASMTLVGVIIGQLSFGAVADLVGRRAASLATAGLTIAGMLASACVVDGGGLDIASALALCRFLSGLGIGGEYPISAAITKEAMSQPLCLTRPQLLLVNIVVLNLGSICQALLVLLLAAARADAEVLWRAPLALGAAPSAVALLFRLQMEQPGTPQAQSSGDVPVATSSRSIYKDVWALRPTLVGCCLSWMLFNFSCYGQGAFSSIICDSLLGQAGEDPITRVKRDAVFAILMYVAIITGCLATGVLMFLDVPYRAIQAAGFFIFSALIWLCRALLAEGTVTAVVFLLATTMNGVLGITTYVVPTESFPSTVRATAVGVSAASGKIGAAIGTFTFPLLEASRGLGAVLLISGGVSMMGAVVTLIFTPRANRTD